MFLRGLRVIFPIDTIFHDGLTQADGSEHACVEDEQCK